MNHGRGAGGGGGGSQKGLELKRKNLDDGSREGFSVLKHIRLTCLQTLPPLKQIREKEGRGVCTQTKIRKLNRRSDDFN